jgi:hypothetical protein
VAVVEQAVEDRRGEDLVTGQDLRPVLDPLVGRDEDAAPLGSGGSPGVDQLEILHGRSRALRLDNGPELNSEALTEWCKELGRAQIHPAGEA